MSRYLWHILGALWLLTACEDHPPLSQPQPAGCLGQHIKIAYTDPAGHQHWSTHQYDGRGRIQITVDSADHWLDSTVYTYAASQVRKSSWINGARPYVTTYSLTPHGHIVWPGYRYNQEGYLIEIDTVDQFHQVNSYKDGNLVKRVVDDGRYQVVYTYTYDTTRLGVPYSMDVLELHSGKSSRNLLMQVKAVSGGIRSNYTNSYTYADFRYEFDSLGRASRCERQHFLYGHSISQYGYACP